MFDKKKAAEYLVVGWVKDWRIRTYLVAIGARNLQLEEIHDHFPWMPDAKNKHYYIKDSRVRTWVALAMRTINDRLWDADTVEKKLALAKQIEKWDSTGVDVPESHKDARRERRNDHNYTKAHEIAHRLSVEEMRKGNGHHWKVVK